jgi:hypothetical protein
MLSPMKFLPNLKSFYFWFIFVRVVLLGIVAFCSIFHGNTIQGWIEELQVGQHLWNGPIQEVL